jgi:hypothetical protein
MQVEGRGPPTYNLTVDAFLSLAETSAKFHEDYLEAISLARQISYFKK